MGKKFRRDESSVQGKLEAIVQLIGWQAQLARSALKQARQEAGLGSGREKSQPKSKRET